MTLLVDELFDNIIITQRFKTTKSFQLAHVRPWIYKHGNGQIGNLTCRVKLAGNVNVLKEVTIDASDLNDAINGTFFHGYVRFDFDSMWVSHDRTNASTEYELEYEFVGTSDASNFYGLCRQFNNLIYPAYGSLDGNGKPKNSFISPYGYELYNLEY